MTDSGWVVKSGRSSAGAGLTRRQFLVGSSQVVITMATVSSMAAAQGAAVGRPSAGSYRFEFALNTATIRGQKLSLVEQIEVTAKAGYDGIEVWTGDLSRFAESGGALGDLRKRCEDVGLKVVSAIGFPQWVVDDDQQRAKGVEQMKREMELVAQIGGTHIAAPPAGVTRPEVKLDLDRAAERYRTILEMGQQTGVIPQLEVWGGSANLSHVAEAIYVAAKSGHKDACILADAFHMYKAGCEPTALRLIGRQVMHCFHINDYPGSPAREVIRDSERIWPGDGIAPLKEMLTYMAENHCQVVLSLELFNPEYWKLPAAEAASTGLAKMKATVAAAGLG